MAVKKKQSTSKPKADPTQDPLVGKKPARKLKVASTEGRSVCLADFEGKTVILYFYPKDNTPGCTTEGLDFRGLIQEFKKQNAIILGVSRDTIQSHQKFKTQCEFPFELLSDPDEALCREFDVIREKSLYGRKYMGVDRSTFVIDPNGKVIGGWRAVKVSGHAEAVLEFVRNR